LMSHRSDSHARFPFSIPMVVTPLLYPIGLGPIFSIGRCNESADMAVVIEKL
jgi:hypothetical protein